MGTRSAARVCAEATRSISGRVVEKILAVGGSAAAKPAGPVVAKLLSKGHQDVGENLIIKGCVRWGPVNVGSITVVFDDGWRDRQRGEGLIDVAREREYV